MYNTVFLSGQQIRLSPQKAIGKGGEADIYDLGGNKALKVYKSPDHPDFVNDPQGQAGARERLATHQQKLPLFPKNLPPRVITPEELAYGRKGGQIVGYQMRFVKGAEVLLRYADKTFRQAGISNEMLLPIFRDLHGSVKGLHQKGVVLGDFNDLNVLVLGSEAYIVDADSFQFEQFPCRVFTARFVDPTLCDPKKTSLMLAKAHNENSDWYAYAVMLMQCLLFVDPYGGVFVPKNPKNKIPHPQRPLKRITVFHPEVRYPKPATPYGVLPDDLLDYFQRTFVQDARGEFPLKLLEMRWTLCSNCGVEHARAVCPVCTTQAPAAIKEVQVVKGTVVASQLFKTPGLIVFATSQGGNLHYLYHENGRYLREDGSTVIAGPLDPQMRFRIQGKSTILGQNGQMVVLTPGDESKRISVDSFGMLPVIDANERNYYWLEGGRLLKQGQYAPDHLGDVLNRQTLFWVGPNFGFGFYRAGALSVAFVFDANRRALNDNVDIKVKGQLVDSTCVFTRERCFFFLATQQSGKTIHQCFVVNSTGRVEAMSEAEKGDGSWLGNSIRGKCAVGNFLLSATDDGIVRVDIDQGQLTLSREFPDTEPFVDSNSNLFPGQGGVYVVTAKTVSLLRIN